MFDPQKKVLPITPAFCFAHARRGFFELPYIEKNAREGHRGKPVSPIALGAVRRLDALFEIERAINSRGADQRRAVRQEKSKPLLEDMHAWLLLEREPLSRSSEVLKPMNYMLRRWEDFARFLDDGRICLTNNCAERALRGIASLESLCAPSLSACKHWKRVRVNFARRATLSGNRCFDRLGRQIGSSNLTRRSRNNLHSRKNAAGDKAADHMT
ncbi:hypothetical protein ABIB85_008193 [Bradyrhizobium sp. JR1.5]